MPALRVVSEKQSEHVPLRDRMAMKRATSNRSKRNFWCCPCAGGSNEESACSTSGPGMSFATATRRALTKHNEIEIWELDFEPADRAIGEMEEILTLFFFRCRFNLEFLLPRGNLGGLDSEQAWKKKSLYTLIERAFPPAQFDPY